MTTWILFVLIVGIPLILITGIILFLFVRLLSGGSGGRDRQAWTEETRLIQELHQALGRMEKRIEALETILLDRDHKKEPNP